MRQLYLDTITGRRKSVGTRLLRLLLRAGTLPYFTAHTLRRFLYRLRFLPSYRFPVPVISVGNLTAGGTGKTPLVEYLAHWCARQHLRTLILARGYGRSSTPGRDDEDLYAEMEIENVVRLTGANRVAVARRALPELKPHVIILDDGFQHYRIRRDLDILTIDATQPFAQGHLIPLGLLREPPSAARRADLIVLSRTDQVTAEQLGDLRARMDLLSGGRPRVEAWHKPVQLRLLNPRRRQSMDWLRERRVYAFCGIGNPEAFHRTLRELKANVVHFQAFDDHHAYTERDHRQLQATAQEFMADTLVTTEKDARKLSAEFFDLPLAALGVEMEIRRGLDSLESRLKELLGGVIKVPGAAATS